MYRQRRTPLRYISFTLTRTCIAALFIAHTQFIKPVAAHSTNEAAPWLPVRNAYTVKRGVEGMEYGYMSRIVARFKTTSRMKEVLDV